MHEIPANVEMLLRTYGVTDAELDELRRTGELHRSGEGGSSTISLSLAGDDAGSVPKFTIDGLQLNQLQLPPGAVENLRRFQRFLPDSVVQNLELASGQDIDGDGQIGGGGSNPAPPPTHGIRRTDSDATAVARPSSTAAPSDGDPFVGGDRGSRALPILLVLLVLAGLAYLAYRSFA